jgi:hypothetical protein
MAALAVHSCAARVVELALTELKGATAASLRLELFGKQFTLFKDEVAAEYEEKGRPTLTNLIQGKPT